VISNVSALRGASKDPDPGDGVVDPGAKPVRRTFTAEYRARIVAEYEAAPRGSKAAVLRREGLYQSQVREWTQARDAAAGMGEAPRPHRASRNLGVGREIARLRSDNERLTRELAQSQAVVEIMGKLQGLLETISESTTTPTSSPKR
jgi:transposase-like protein